VLPLISRLCLVAAIGLLVWAIMQITLFWLCHAGSAGAFHRRTGTRSGGTGHRCSYGCLPGAKHDAATTAHRRHGRGLSECVLLQVEASSSDHRSPRHRLSVSVCGNDPRRGTVRVRDGFILRRSRFSNGARHGSRRRNRPPGVEE